MAPVAGAPSTPTDGRRRGKKSGVPTRDKLSKAIALVQSSKQKVAPAKLDLTHLADGIMGEDERLRMRPSPRPPPYAASPMESGTPNTSSSKDAFGNDFANNLYRAIHHEPEPVSPRQKQGLTPRAAAVAAKKKQREQQQHPGRESPRPGTPTSMTPLTPRAAAAAAFTAGKRRSRHHESPRPGTPTSTTPLTPRAAAAAAISAEKRRSRARREKLEKINTAVPHPSTDTNTGSYTTGSGIPKNPIFSRKSAEEALASVAAAGRSGSGTSGGSGSGAGRRVNPTGKYHREKNYTTHQEDVDAAVKFSSDIEKDIQATSQTLAKISEFIDTVSSKPRKGSTKSSGSNSSFARDLQERHGVIVLDDNTIDSSAAVAEVDEAREPESTRGEVTEDDTKREAIRSSAETDQFAGVGVGIQNTGRIYLEDNTAFDSLATYASKAATSMGTTLPNMSLNTATAAYAATMEEALEFKQDLLKTKKESPRVKRETPQAKKETFKSAGFDALLNVAAATLSDKYMSNFQKQQSETILINAYKAEEAQIPIQAGSDKSSTKQEIPIQRGPAPVESDNVDSVDNVDNAFDNAQQSEGSKHPPILPTAKGTKKIQSAATGYIPILPGDHRDTKSEASSGAKIYTARSGDPPDVAPVPNTMGSHDELQPKHFSFDSLDSSRQALEGVEDGLDIPHNPNLLSQIADFIDKVEQKKKKSTSAKAIPIPSLKDPMLEALDTATFANDFDAATLANIFDEPLTPKHKRDKEGTANKKDGRVRHDAEKERNEVNILLEKVKTNGGFSDAFSVADTTTLASKLPDKESTWLEMERLLNNISEQKRQSTPDADVSSEDAVRHQPVEDSDADQLIKEASGGSDGGKTSVASDSDSGARSTRLEIDTKLSSSKEEDPICVVRGDMAGDTPKGSKESKSQPALLIDTKSNRRQQLEPSPKHTNPNSTAFALLTSSQSLAARRGADPPDYVAARPRKDPPAEIVSPGGLQTSSTPRGHTTFASPASSPEKAPQKGRKQMEPSPRNSDAVEIHKSKPRSGPTAPKPEHIVSGTNKVKVLHIDIREAGTETRPINVECHTPTPKAGGDDSVVFVDLTEVNSGDICKDKEENDEPSSPTPQTPNTPVVVPPATPNPRRGQPTSPKRWKDVELDFAAQDRALQELMSMAEESPRKASGKAVHVFDHVLSVDSEDGVSIANTSTSSGSAEIVSVSDSSLPLVKQLNKEKSNDVSNTKKEEVLELATSSSSIEEEHDDKTESTTTETSAPSKQPPGDYSGDEAVDGASRVRAKETDGAQVESDEDQTETDDFLEIVGSRMSQIVSEDDHDPMQSLLFAQHNSAPETSERKEAGMSLIQLTLDEVKNFVDSNLFDEGGVSKQRIRDLEQLEQTVPSLLTDLGDDIIDHVASDACGNDTEPEEEDIDDGSLNEGRGITVTYDFQPASEQSSDTHRTGKEERRQRRLASPKKSGKKGLKRKHSYEEKLPSINTQDPGTDVPGPANWLASLDQIFSCKQTPPGKSKNRGPLLAETSSGEMYDIPSDPSSLYQSSFEPSSVDPSVKSQHLSPMAHQDKGSDLKRNVPTPKNGRKSNNRVKKPVHQAFSEDSAKTDDSTTKQEATSNTEDETSDVSACTEEEAPNPAQQRHSPEPDPKEKQVDHSQPTQSAATPFLFLSVETGERSTGKEDSNQSVSNGKKSSETPPKSLKDDVQRGNEDDDKRHLAMAAEMLPAASSLQSSDEGREATSTAKIYVVSGNNEKPEEADSYVVEVSSSTDNDSAPPLDNIASRNVMVASQPDQVAEQSETQRPLEESPDLLKFASQSESFAEIRTHATKEVQKGRQAAPQRPPKINANGGNRTVPTERHSPKHKAASPKSPTNRIEDQQAVINTPPPADERKTIIAASNPMTAKSRVAEEKQSELMRQASSMMGPTTSDYMRQASSMLGPATSENPASEPASPHPATSPRDSNQEAKGQKPNLFRFASQSESLPDHIEETLQERSHSKPPRGKQASKIEQPAEVKSPRSLREDPSAVYAMASSTIAGNEPLASPKVTEVSSAGFDVASPKVTEASSAGFNVSSPKVTEASSGGLPAYNDEESVPLPDRYSAVLQGSSSGDDISDDNLSSVLGSYSAPESPKPRSTLQTAQKAASTERVKSTSGWEKFVDLTDMEEEEHEDEATKEGKEKKREGEQEQQNDKYNAWEGGGEHEQANDKYNAWETSLDLESLQDESSNMASWERLKGMDPEKKQEEETEVIETTREDDAGLSPREDQTPKMHQNKRFDFIESVDEDDNIDAYFSRMTSLKQGGHLPNLDIQALGSQADKGQEDEADAIEVDFDVGFVKKALAPVLSEDEDDERRNRYISIEESVDEDDPNQRRYSGPRLDTISDEDDESSYVPSSASYTERASVRSDEESVGSSANNPIVVDSVSASLSDQPTELVPIHRGRSGYGADVSIFRTETRESYRQLQLDALSYDHQSMSYESDNDEWLRKRDLATRKTHDPKSWLTRTTSGIQSKLSFVTVETPKAINGVAAAKKLLSKQPKLRGGRRRNPIPSSKTWKLSYKERTKEHSGYFDVDFFSLFDSSAVGALPAHHLDLAPWESRDVRQHFLHDHSIGFSRNWFGKAQRKRGNDRIKERVAHPKSMEMPMENKPHPNEWEGEWYKTWKAPNSNSSRSITSSSSVSRSGTEDRDGAEESDSATHQDETSSYVSKSSHSESRLSEGSSYSTNDHMSASDFTEGDEYEDTPQCGTLINVKPKIGERVSRIHPDYTSQLRRSRWRKKYFPRGTFPYEK